MDSGTRVYIPVTIAYLWNTRYDNLRRRVTRLATPCVTVPSETPTSWTRRAGHATETRQDDEIPPREFGSLSKRRRLTQTHSVRTTLAQKPRRPSSRRTQPVLRIGRIWSVNLDVWDPSRYAPSSRVGRRGLAGYSNFDKASRPAEFARELSLFFLSSSIQNEDA